MERDWMDFYKLERQFNYIGLAGIIFVLIIASTYLVFPPVFIELFFLEALSHITAFIICLGIYIYSKNMMKVYKNCETRAFGKLSYKNIADAERLLQSKDIKYEKMGEKRLNYFVTFNETLKIDDKIYLKFRTPYSINQPIDKLHPIYFSYLHISICTKPGYNENIVKKLKSTIDQLENVSK